MSHLFEVKEEKPAAFLSSSQMTGEGGGWEFNRSFFAAVINVRRQKIKIFLNGATGY